MPDQSFEQFLSSYGGAGSAPSNGTRSVPSLTGSVWSMVPIAKLADIMERYEAGSDPNSVARRNNNPGNIKGTDGNFLKFSTPEAGKQYQIGYLTRLSQKYPDLTLEGLTSHYLGGDRVKAVNNGEGNSVAYANFIRKHAGLDEEGTTEAPTNAGSFESFLQSYSPAAGVMNSNVGGNDDFATFMATNSAEAASAAPDESGAIEKAWNWANTGLVSGDTINRALTGKTGEGYSQEIANKDLQHLKDVASGKDQPKEFSWLSPSTYWDSARRAMPDISNTLSGFTSPLSLATMAMGPATRGLKLASKATEAVEAANALRKSGAVVRINPLVEMVGKNGKLFNRAYQTANVLNRGVDAAFAVEGGLNTAKNFADAQANGWNVQNILGTALGTTQALGGTYGASRGLFADRMEQPHSKFPSMTRREVYEGMTGVEDPSMRISPDLAMATESPLLKKAKAVLQNSFGGSGTFERNAERNANAAHARVEYKFDPDNVGTGISRAPAPVYQEMGPPLTKPRAHVLADELMENIDPTIKPAVSTVDTMTAVGNLIFRPGSISTRIMDAMILPLAEFGGAQAMVDPTLVRHAITPMTSPRAMALRAILQAQHNQSK